jgi:hypothetical protein
VPENRVWWLNGDGQDRLEVATPDHRSQSLQLEPMARSPKALSGHEAPATDAGGLLRRISTCAPSRHLKPGLNKPLT